MTDALKLFPDAAEAAARAFKGDPAIDAIVFRIFPDPMFPGPTDADGFNYAAFYKTPGWPATLWGVYASDELAAANVAERKPRGFGESTPPADWTGTDDYWAMARKGLD